MLSSGRAPAPRDLLPLLKSALGEGVDGTLCTIPKFTFHKIAKGSWRKEWQKASSAPVSLVVGDFVCSPTTLLSAFESNACKNCLGMAAGAKSPTCQFSFVVYVFARAGGKHDGEVQ